ncbi:MAG: GNAT family N-acetyltransferase [Anaerolineales bacterium]|nr:GNAT family N-acetyltransferase [Anaerolineales bacterium]
MDVKSLGYKTDLIFPAFDGEIVDRGDYLVVRTPSNPDFYWGNFLLFENPPAGGDYARWKGLFAREIGIPPQTEHLTFGWDTVGGETGEDEEFLVNGFRRARSTVLAARALRPPAHPAAEVTVRPLVSDTDWAQAVQNQVDTREPEFTESEYRGFRARAMDRYRRMAACGLGDWFGAFRGRTLAADLGIFRDGKIGRCQSVQTRPEHRRRGYAGTLVYEASRYAMDRYGLETLVIVAETDSDAGRLYRSLDFAATEFQSGLEKWKFDAV